MYHFEFVSKKQRAPIKKQLISIILEVQNLLRDEFTFRFDFVGSDKYNMVTHDPKTNIGFDFDINIEVNNEECNFTAKEIKTKLILAFNQVVPKYGYDHAEDSTRVITIKYKDRQNSKILHSCDFAIVNNYVDAKGYDRQKYIRFNKKQNTYSWAEQSKGYYMLSEKAEWIKEKGYHKEMKELYLDKKNHNRDRHKHSRALYAETIHTICQKYGFYD
ncbi:MAG: hypothetical protein J1F02_02625 [Lachnospiraceae bacterium]|nr:hypothetical protein [Lachnospiraceae bacterium]